MEKLLNSLTNHIKQSNSIVYTPLATYIIGVASISLLFLLLGAFENSIRLILALIAFIVLLAIAVILFIRQAQETSQSSSSTEDRLRLYFSLLPERVLIMNYDGIYLDVLQPHYGVNRLFIGADRMGRSVHEVFEKEFADYCLKNIRHSIDSQSTQTIEYERLENDGKSYFVEASVVPFKDPINGEPRALWVSHDITQRKQAEQGLKDSEHRLRSFVTALPDRIIILDDKGYYHDIMKDGDKSDYIQNVGGFVGDSLRDVFDEEFTEFCLSKVHKALEENALQVFEYTIKDNQTFRLEGRVIPYRDPESGEPRVIWLSRDITASKNMRDSLVENEKLLRSIIESLPDRTMIFDEDGRYQEILQPAFNNNHNPTWLTTIQIGKTLKDIFPDEFADYCLEMIHKTIETGQIQIFQYPSPVTELPLYFEARTVPFRDVETGKTRVLWVTRDITDQKENEERQIELAIEREKLEFFQQFVGNMTHDLKTPLTVIGTSLYLLEKSKDDSTRQRRIDVIHRQLELLQQMIDDMLTIGRLDSIPQLELEPMDYIGLLQETITELMPRAEQKSQQLQVSITTISAIIPTSKNEMRRAMTNLIDNAIKYTPDFGHVDVRVYPDNEVIVTEVQDTGIGIQSVDLPYIFDRFFRSDNGRSVANGTGLGLAITQRIIELHGGQIEVESMIGQGTTFRVRLPSA